MKLIDNPKTNRLCESFQSNDTKFAFATENAEGSFQLIHTWVKCREYFNELLMKNYHPAEFSFDEVHGFVYEHDKFPMDLSRTVIAMKFPNDTYMNTFIENLPILHQVEELNDVADRTVIHKVTSHPTTVLVTASKFWIQKALLTNIFTLLLKTISLNIKNTSIDKLNKQYVKEAILVPSEVSYITQIGTQKVNKILNNLTLIATTPTKYVDGSEEIRPAYVLHAWSGIVTYVSSPHNTPAKFGKIIQGIVNSKKEPVMVLS